MVTDAVLEKVTPADFNVPQLFPYQVKDKTFKMDKKRVLVTGAAGFFGHHFIEHIFENTNWDVVGMVRMSKIGTLHRLMDTDIAKRGYENGRLEIVWHDFNSPVNPFVAEKIGHVDYIVHAGAETHVDRSITDPLSFAHANTMGTLNMLEYARTLDNLTWFNFFSTDEVYGPAAPGVDFPEDAPLNATNPYSAAKAAAEQFVNAYGNTYELPVFITNTMNLFGERANSEKFSILLIKKILAGEKIYIHANPEKTEAGSRFYLHGRNAASAVLFLLQNAGQRERYNIVGSKEVTNLELAQLVHRFINDWRVKNNNMINLPLDYELVDFHSSRPGHDLRYALDGTKLASMGFSYPVSYEESLRRTVFWTLDNQEWLI